MGHTTSSLGQNLKAWTVSFCERSVGQNALLSHAELTKESGKSAGVTFPEAKGTHLAGSSEEIPEMEKGPSLCKGKAGLEEGGSV